MERLSFGHGFIPRIGRQNHRALDRAMSQPGLFGEEPFQIPWVIVDGAWIRPDAALLRQLRGLGVRILRLSIVAFSYPALMRGSDLETNLVA